MVGNVGFLQAGMPLLPDAAIDDGLLDVVLLYPRAVPVLAPPGLPGAGQAPRTDELIARMCGSQGRRSAPGDTPRQLDGDLIAPGRELRATCVHGRLLVRVPR